jgi:hypothetical protein
VKGDAAVVAMSKSAMAAPVRPTSSSSSTALTAPSGPGVLGLGHNPADVEHRITIEILL